MRLKVKRLHPAAQMPRYATTGSACFDLHALVRDDPSDWVTPIEVSQAKAATIRTGLAIEVPRGFALLVFSRSGHGFSKGVRLANCVGVIDSDYRGEILVRLTGDINGAGIEIRHGDRIAQAMLVQAPWLDLDEVDELSDTQRGTGGFGSTGE